MPINPADINQIQGTYATLPPFTSSIGTIKPSAVAGNEGVAEVLSVGSGVKSVAKGDWVIMAKTGFGTWRTHAQCSEEHIIRIEKEGLSPSQACTVGVNPCTAYRMLKDFVNLKEGDWWIQNGANSGVGRTVIQLGKLWGLRSINVIRGRPNIQQVREELKGLGADIVVTEEEIMDRGFSEKIKSWTDGGREPVRLGLNCVGGKPATALARSLSPEAHLVTYGAMSKQPLMLPTGLLIFKDLHFDGFWVSKWNDNHPEERERMVLEILGLIREGKLKGSPVREVNWGWDTKRDDLVSEIQSTLEGFRDGKGVFKINDEID
ncbi:MAG: mitochondrial 2-enoyl thioester reductase [Vezdaea acicularis]|nr:MAG: mitochondrial 2-enoyl thioester reductase [Vezdaea acicularis]